MGDEQRDGDCDIDGDDGGDCDETLGFQDMVVRRSDEQSEPCPVRRLFYTQKSQSLPLPLDEGEKADVLHLSVSTARPCRLGGARSVRLHVGARGWITGSGR